VRRRFKDGVWHRLSTGIPIVPGPPWRRSFALTSGHEEEDCRAFRWSARNDCCLKLAPMFAAKGHKTVVIASAARRSSFSQCAVGGTHPMPSPVSSSYCPRGGCGLAMTATNPGVRLDTGQYVRTGGQPWQQPLALTGRPPCSYQASPSRTHSIAAQAVGSWPGLSGRRKLACRARSDQGHPRGQSPRGTAKPWI
jgi:hypothetical protein